MNVPSLVSKALANALPTIWVPGRTPTVVRKDRVRSSQATTIVSTVNDRGFDVALDTDEDEAVGGIDFGTAAAGVEEEFIVPVLGCQDGS